MTSREGISGNEYSRVEEQVELLLSADLRVGTNRAKGWERAGSPGQTGSPKHG